MGEKPPFGVEDLYRSLGDSHEKLRRGQVWCRTCGHTETVDPAVALQRGWPRHCGDTMTIDAPEERG